MTGHFYPANTSQASKKFPGCPLKITVAVLTGQFLSGKLVFAKQKRASHRLVFSGKFIGQPLFAGQKV